MRNQGLSHRRIPVALLFVFSAIAFQAPARAQVDRAGLSGTVTDPSGRVLPQAQVTAIQNATGLQRKTTSSATGTYDIPELPVGNYSITIEHQGFKTLTYVDVEEVVGRTRILDATLQVSGNNERVEVSGSSEQVDKMSDALGGRIEQAQARELPLNGRNWATLTALVPGAVDTGGSNQRSIRFAGRGRDDDNFTYDGIDATNIVNQPSNLMFAWPFHSTPSRNFVSTPCWRPPKRRNGRSATGRDLTFGHKSWHGDVFEFLAEQRLRRPSSPFRIVTTRSRPFT